MDSTNPSAIAGGTLGAPFQPLVSILSFCKDRAWSIRRSVDSVLGQSYRHLEFVVQDGASTDGTLDLLESCQDGRIKLVSEPDSGPAEAFWKVLNRCQGDIIGTCLSDEALLPDAVERAVELFRTHPDLGAVTCDGYMTDEHGRDTARFVAGEFDLVNYLFGRYCPFWPGTFFRRQALLDVGLGKPGWTIDALEFEVWCRLGTQHRVKYFPELMSRYTVHSDQLSNTPKNFNEHMDGRMRLVARLFPDDGTAGSGRAARLACMYNQYFLFYNHARAYRISDQMEALYDRMLPLLKDLDRGEWERQRATPRVDAVASLKAPEIPRAADIKCAALYDAGTSRRHRARERSAAGATSRSADIPPP